jgi:hypothetical protein
VTLINKLEMPDTTGVPINVTVLCEIIKGLNKSQSNHTFPAAGMVYLSYNIKLNSTASEDDYVHPS